MLATACQCNAKKYSHKLSLKAKLPQNILLVIHALKIWYLTTLDSMSTINETHHSIYALMKTLVILFGYAYSYTHQLSEFSIEVC